MVDTDEALKRAAQNPYVYNPDTRQAVNTLDPHGNRNVILADQTTRPLDLYFVHTFASTTLAATSRYDDLTVTLTDASAVSAGDQLTFLGPIQAPTKASVARMVSKVGNVVTLDTPLDDRYAIGDHVSIGSIDMNIDGSSTPVRFKVRGAGAGAPARLPNIFDITRIMLQITTTDPPEFSDFGDIASGLTKGIYLRHVDGGRRNIWNIKSNAELAVLTYDFNVYSAALPINVNGVAARYSLAGQEKHGVAVRITPYEDLEIVVQDDLSSLISFHALAQGHVTND